MPPRPPPCTRGRTGSSSRTPRSTSWPAACAAWPPGTLVIDSRVAAAVLRPEQRLLSGHELSILELVAEGLTNREIGARLHLSHYTVKDYLTRIMRKLGTRSRAETVARAVQQGLLAGRS